MKQHINEVKRMQQLAGINEMKVNKPLSFVIEPRDEYTGVVFVGGHPVEYNTQRDDKYVHLNICTSYEFLESINSPLVDMFDEDGNPDEGASEESKKLCDSYLDRVKQSFGPDVTINMDDYGIYYYSIPKNSFYKRISSTNRIQQVDDDTFTYKNKTLKIKKLSPAELEKYIDDCFNNYIIMYPHLKNTKYDSKEHLTNMYFSEKPYYYILDDKGNYYINPYKGGAMLPNKPLPVSHKIIFSDLYLNLKPIFDNMPVWFNK